MQLKIRHKLFLAILAANVLLAASIYLMSSWVFSSSFRDYLDQSTAERLAPMVNAVGEKYQQYRHWRWVKQQRGRQWRELLHQYVLAGAPPEHDTPAGTSPGNPDIFNTHDQPPPDRQQRQKRRLIAGVNPRLLLTDANKNLVLGNPERTHDAYWIPINVDNEIVGYLGFIRTLALTSKLDQLFANRMKSSFIWIAIGLLGITLLIAFPVAKILVKPIVSLRQASSALAAGDYQVRLPVQSHDEIGDLCRDFNHLAATLEKNLGARRQWVADISHELRTPVAILQGEIEALQDGVRQLTPGAVHSLHQEVLNLSSLVNDLYELSLSDMGALSYKMTEVNIIDIIDDIVHHYQPAARKKSIAIHFDQADSVLKIQADPNRLTQLFKNLMNNSLFYTDEGGRLDINIVHDPERIAITWADSKPGVSNEALPRLFDRLYRVEASRNRNTGGSGLGLAISKNIVEAHHGTITAKHSPTGGVAFHIVLPVYS